MSPRSLCKPVRLDLFWRKVDRRLRVYGASRHGNFDDPLDELVYIILSAQTESYLYSRTFEALRKAFNPWDLLLSETPHRIAKIIRYGGLAHKKAAYIKRSFHKILADTGSLSLVFLRNLPDSAVRQYLTSLPGVGAKTAACVMLYSLGRPVFPVDTHIWRISRRLGVAAPFAKPTDAQERELEDTIPLSLRYRLHVNLLSHGQQTCTTYRPKCSGCVLADLCPSRGERDRVWNDWRCPRGVWAQTPVRPC